MHICLSDWCFYLEKLFLILKQTSLPISILTKPEGCSILEKITYFTQLNMENYSRHKFEESIESIYSHVGHLADSKRNSLHKEYLSYCHLKTGRKLWLCDFHKNHSQVNYSSKNVENTNFSTLIHKKPSTNSSLQENKPKFTTKVKGEKNEGKFEKEKSIVVKKSNDQFEDDFNIKNKKQKKAITSLILNNSKQKSQACILS